jgi:hypothetical protein|tara:strand:+ start:364 stop:759 length:396 start_codon:yes stop_codon:yes gene_type:complete
MQSMQSNYDNTQQNKKADTTKKAGTTNFPLCAGGFQWPALTARERQLQHACNGAVLSKTDIQGGDLATVDLPVMKGVDDLITRCCVTCANRPNCKGFTLLGRTCWVGPIIVIVANVLSYSLINVSYNIDLL